MARTIVGRVLAGRLLDVTLSRDGATRSWSVGPCARNASFWSYTKHGPDRVIYGELPTRDEAVAKRRQFDAEIAAAHADGWE